MASLLPTMSKSNKDVAGTTPAETPAAESAGQAKKPDRGPVWDDASNRVKVAVFRHAHDDGKVRYTIGINRSYKDDAGQWHNTHFFDEKDLPDVIAAVQMATERIDRFKDHDRAA